MSKIDLHLRAALEIIGRKIMGGVYLGVSAKVGVSARGGLNEGCLAHGEGVHPLDPEANTHTLVPEADTSLAPTLHVNRMTDRQVSKHYLSATTVADGNNRLAPLHWSQPPVWET